MLEYKKHYDEVIEESNLTYEEVSKLLPKNWEDLFTHTSLCIDNLKSEYSKYDVKIMRCSTNKYECRFWILKTYKDRLSSTYHDFVSYDSESRCGIYSSHFDAIYEEETMHAVLMNVFYENNVLILPLNYDANSIVHDAIDY